MRKIIYAFAVGCYAMWAGMSAYQTQLAHRQMAQAAHRQLASIMIATPPTVLGKGKVVLVQAASNGQFYVDGDVLGTMQVFLVDTGAADVALRYDVATSVGLRWQDGREKCYSSANGKVCARTFLAPWLTIAGITKKDVIVAMFPDGALQGNLLGMSFLEKVSRYEFRPHMLRLED